MVGNVRKGITWRRVLWGFVAIGFIVHGFRVASGEPVLNASIRGGVIVHGGEYSPLFAALFIGAGLWIGYWVLKNAK